jgi:formylglycine-generating enzyme required for sulfatase activity
MGRRLSGALGACAIACVLAACNLISGASNLEVCSDCGPEGTIPARDGDAGRATDAQASDGSTLPATCTDGQTACDGNVAARCVGSAWQKTTCEQLCENGQCAAFPSCRDTAKTGCGVANESCCTPIAVPGGTFNRRGAKDLPATVSPFVLDKYEVTVGRFRAFVAAGGATRANPPKDGAGGHPKIAASGWRSEYVAYLPADTAALLALLRSSGGSWTDAPGANEGKPINRVSWMLAFAFCAWDRGRLPTYAEWDFAAAGGAQQRYYPWSSPPDATTISTDRAAYDCAYSAPARACPPSYCNADGSTPCNATTCASLGGACVTPPCTGCASPADIAPVGVLALGAGRWGHLDLAGNVGEMVLDANAALPVPCNDCARLVTFNSQDRIKEPFIVAGGSWSSSAGALRTASSSSISDDETDADVGFRCAR